MGNNFHQDQSQSSNPTIHKIVAYLKLARVNQPIGYLLLLYPTIIPLLIFTNGIPPIKTFIIFIIGVFVMRSAGCIINDIADRNIDNQVERTKYRPLTSGDLSLSEAISAFVVLVAIAFFLVIQLSALTIGLSIISLIIAILYPFSKRFFKLPQLILALAFSMPIPMIYAEIIGNIWSLDILLLMVFNISWTIAYDTQYAISDRVDDQKLGINSSAIFFAKHDTLIINILFFISWIAFLLLGINNQYGVYFYIIIAIIPILFVYQYFLIRDYDSFKCQQAFKSNNTIGIFYVFATCLGILSNSITN